MNKQITYHPTRHENRVRVYLNGEPTLYTVNKVGAVYSLHWDSVPLLNYWKQDETEMHEMVQKLIGNKCEKVD